MMAQEGLRFSIDFGTRLSGKNILIVLALVLIGARMMRDGRLRVELPIVHVCFVVLVAYGVATWFIAAFVIEYPMYPVWSNFVYLKLLLLDRFLVFLAFFYGPRTQSEVLWLLRALLGVVIFAQVITVGETLGVLPTNYVGVRESGRVVGLIGESNQFALFTASFVPALLAFVATARGPWRILWLVGALLSVASFGMTLSRGATVGVLVSIFLGAVIFHRQFSVGLVLRWVVAGAAVIATGLSLVWGRYGDLIYERIVTQTFREQTMSGASMGRTDIWIAAMDRMIEYPVTLLTGFGWRAYWSLPQVLAPHNTYIDFWFNLGLPGLVSFVTILVVGVAVSYRAASLASGLAGTHLRAFAFGLLAVIGGLMFTEWYEPWSYFWPYFGLAMRLAVLTIGEDKRLIGMSKDASLGQGVGSASGTGGPYGWSSRPLKSRLNRPGNTGGSGG
jgi:O-antigen ligase